jgi:uncharacterized protein (TIGR03437 family)
MRACILLLGLSLAVCPVAGQDGQAYLNVDPFVYFSGGLDDPLSSFRVGHGKGDQSMAGSMTTIGIGGSAAGLQFKVDRVELRNSPVNFIVLSPTSGTVPALVKVALNESVVRTMPPGAYNLIVFFSIVGQTQPSRDGVSVYLNLALPPPPAVEAVVGTVSVLLKSSPGEFVSIYGTHLGQPETSASPGELGLYPKALAGTSVTFNGIAAPLLYMNMNQINALVPYELAGQKTADVVVKRSFGQYDQTSAAFTVPILDTSPGIVTTQYGRGQGAILNLPDSSLNGAENPALPGSAITLYATGSGVWSQAVENGSIFLGPIYPLITPIAPVSLTIGGQPATILYSGPAPYQLWELLQINAIVPSGAGSGQRPVVLTIGQNDNSAQEVTMAIK